jgi:hypothetical protein
VEDICGHTHAAASAKVPGTADLLVTGSTPKTAAESRIDAIPFACSRVAPLWLKLRERVEVQ